MDFKTSWGMLTGKIPKSEEYHQMTAANQAHQVASQHDDPGGNIYNAMYQNAYGNSLANNMPNTAAQNNGSGDRPRSSFRNPQAGGLLSFFGGGSRLGDQPMTTGRFLENALIPGLGILRGFQRAAGNQPYEMTSVSGSGTYDPDKVNAMIAASQTPQSANPGSMSRAQVSSPQEALAKIQDYGGYTPEPVETSILTPIRNEMSSFGFSPDTVGQPSDPLYVPGGEFDAFMENVGSLPQFDEVRANPVKMRAAFEAYRKAVQAQGGAK